MVGEPAEIEVGKFVWTPENRDHIGRHFVTPTDVDYVLANTPAFFLNLPGRSATHVMVGRDPVGRALYVAIRRAGESDEWVVITAWESRVARRMLETVEGKK